jgi:AcrR family transcriptional regulator
VSGTKADILAVARDLFLEQGLDGLSMRAVATRVGVSATAIYRHYRDKKDLLAATVAGGFQLFGGYLSQALQQPTPRERLLATGQQVLRFAFEHPRYYQVLFMAWEELGLLDLPRPRPGTASPGLQFLLDRVDECARAGLLRAPADPMQTALLCWAEVHGLASLWLAGGGREHTDEERYRAIADGALRQLVDGLLLPGAKGRSRTRSSRSSADGAPRSAPRRR